MIPFATPMMAAPAVIAASAGIQYVGGAKGEQGTTTATHSLTSLTGGIGSAPADDDYAILAVTNASNNALSIGTTGWDVVYNAQIQDATAGIRLSTLFARKKLTAADTEISLTRASVWAIQVFRGVDPTTPMDVTYQLQALANDRPLPNPPAITPVTEGAWVVACGSGHGAFDANDFTSSDLTNFLSQQNESTSFDPLVGMGYIPDWESGAVDPAQFGGGTTANPTWCSAGAITFALRPA